MTETEKRSSIVVLPVSERHLKHTLNPSVINCMPDAGFIEAFNLKRLPDQSGPRIHTKRTFEVEKRLHGSTVVVLFESIGSDRDHAFNVRTIRIVEVRPKNSGDNPFAVLQFFFKVSLQRVKGNGRIDRECFFHVVFSFHASPAGMYWLISSTMSIKPCIVIATVFRSASWCATR